MKQSASAAEAALVQPAAAAPARSFTLLWCLLGLLVPRASLYGQLAPFGIGLAAAVCTGRLPVLLCLCVGYLLAQPVLLPLRYVGAVGMVGGIRWVLETAPAWERHPAVPPLLAFVSALSTGLMVLSQTGMDSTRVLLITAESVVAAGAAAVFDSVLRLEEQLTRHPGESRLTPGKQASLTVVGAVAVMAAATLEVEGYAPGRALASFLILVLARSGREAGGSMAGVIMGSAMALARPGQAALALAMAFGGLMAGLFSRFGRPAQAALYLLSAGVVTLGETAESIPAYLWEMGAACLLFCLLPREWERALRRLFIPNRELPAVEGVRRLTGMRLRLASAALTEVGDSVGEVSRKLAAIGAPDPAALYTGCRQAVCGSCPMQAVCWEQHREETEADLHRLTPLLEQGAVLTADRIGGYLGAHCRRIDRLADYAGGTYARFLAQEGAWQRLRDIQAAAQEQFSGTAGLLRSLAGQLEDPRQVDADLSAQVLAVCEDFGILVRDALCIRDGTNRLTVDILAAEGSLPAVPDRWLRRLSKACAREFSEPVLAAWGDAVRVTLQEPPRYRVAAAVCQLCHGKEKLCGDTAAVFSAGDSFVAMLSDGMGSGGRAAVDSTMTVGIASRLWKAGFSPAAILQTVNAALLVKDREETLSTLDTAVIHTATGRLDSYKAGAAVTLLKSGGRVSRLEGTSLPVGILPEITFAHSHDRLTEGDILLLMSDGALADGVGPVEEQLGAFPEGGSLEELARTVAEGARQASGEHMDDITVAALQLQPAAL